MTKFKICADEKVYYEVEVEAENLEEAKNKVYNGDIQLRDEHIVDSSDFEIDGRFSGEIISGWEEDEELDNQGGVTDEDREELSKLIKAGNTSGIFDSETHRMAWELKINKFKH
jgi:hypothetical protein